MRGSRPHEVCGDQCLAAVTLRVEYLLPEVSC